jgi:hypothetical protein
MRESRIREMKRRRRERVYRSRLMGSSKMDLVRMKMRMISSMRKRLCLIRIGNFKNKTRIRFS